MQINSDIVDAASERIERRYGAGLTAPPAPKARAVLDASRIARVARYVNENRPADDISALERAMGENDLLSLYYFWAGLRAAQSVGRIQIPPGPGDRGGYATGFMIAPGLLMTNWHVFKMEDDARRARVQFGYESDPTGNERVSTSFSFEPDRFFLADESLDYCIVAVSAESRQGPDPIGSFGWLRLNPQLGKADYGQFLSIIQHPGGQTKQIAIRENKLFPFDDSDRFLTYQSDTFRGSSGSPVFNDLWDIVALHHSGKPLKDDQGRYIGHDGQPISDHKPLEHEIKWVANEGARISRIVADVLARATSSSERDALEAAVKGELTPSPSGFKQNHVATERAATPIEFASTSSAKTADRNFVVVLPFDVSLKVESLMNRPVEPASSVPPVALAAPPVARAAGTDEFLFEKLNFDFDYDDRRGYDEGFLGRERVAPMPSIAPNSRDQIAPRKRGGRILYYHHYSVMVHAKRRMPVLSACNVDYSQSRRKITGRKTFGKDEWITDSRLEDEYQLSRGFYDRWKKLDYGHLVRRDDNAWGASRTEIEFANADTFHLTNCTPQHESFNRDAYGFHGLWGRLENHISEQATSDRALARLCIFAGPIFSKKDLKLEDEGLGCVYVPLSFWKVVIAPARSGGLRAFGFITRQSQDLEDEPPFEEFTPEGFEDEQVSLEHIEKKTIVRFDDKLKHVDAMLDHPDENEIMPLSDLHDVWLGRR